MLSLESEKKTSIIRERAVSLAIFLGHTVVDGVDGVDGVDDAIKKNKIKAYKTVHFDSKTKKNDGITKAHSLFEKIIIGYLYNSLAVTHDILWKEFSEKKIEILKKNKKMLEKLIIRLKFEKEQPIVNQDYSDNVVDDGDLDSNNYYDKLILLPHHGKFIQSQGRVLILPKGGSTTISIDVRNLDDIQTLYDFLLDFYIAKLSEQILEINMEPNETIETREISEIIETSKVTEMGGISEAGEMDEIIEIGYAESIYSYSGEKGSLVGENYSDDGEDYDDIDSLIDSLSDGTQDSYSEYFDEGEEKYFDNLNLEKKIS
jgi:hypothetical protein